MQYATRRFEAIGTQWELLLDSESASQITALMPRVQARIAAFDWAYSRFRADSLVTALSRAAGTYALPADGYPLLQLYEKLYYATDGQVTPLIGQVLSDAGYDAAYSFARKPLTRPPRWEDVITYDQEHITLSRPALLDFGAAGKGYLVDIIAELLRGAGLHSFVINASGDVLHRSSSGQGIDIGLENPFDNSEIIGTVQLQGKSLCASAGTKRQWQNMHHIISPHTLRPASKVVATWVIADDTMTADGLATALFFTDPQLLRKQFTFAYALMDHQHGLSYSRDFPVQLFEAAHA